MIVSGSVLSILDWRKAQSQRLVVEGAALEGELKALAKLAEAIKGYPFGQQLIVWGIVVLIIAGLFGGISHL
jgi:hypothetical protein